MTRHRTIHIVFASTSGHTEYVMKALLDSLHRTAPGWRTESTRAERAQPQDLFRGDILLLASGTWNTGSVEGQLNPYMQELLERKAKDLDLAGKACACVGLGDRRYFYEGRSADLLKTYLEVHHGQLLLPPLRIIDEPYGQEQTVALWARQLVKSWQHVGVPTR